MTIHKLFVAVLTLAVAVGFSGVPAVLQPVVTLEAQQRTAKLKGTLKSLDTSAAVITPNDNKKVEVTFELTETTERSGDLEPGAEIEVVYYVAQAKRVATQLIGKAPKN